MVKSLMLVLVLSTLLSTQVMAACSKADAKKAVLAACKLIETKGKAALKDIGKNRHCGSNYVWIQDADVKMVLHPIKRRLNGKSLKANTDEDGKKLFVEFDKMANKKAKGGWVNYKWAKAGAEKATAKTSFVKKCGGSLGWIAGSGIWL